MADDRDELLALLTRRSFVHRSDRPFQLASGRTSPYYLDGKKTTLDGRGALLVGRLLFERLRGRNIQAIGGLTLGADPIALAVAMTGALAGEPVRAFIVRKEPKGHGTGNWIEGGLDPASRVAVVEDVVTSGKSICQAIERIQAAGHLIVAAVALVDRDEGGAEAVRHACGLPLEALFHLKDFLPPT
ncbi:MAG: orotate phosphoribosyltransferase [Nitrospirota bacterium]